MCRWIIASKVAPKDLSDMEKIVLGVKIHRSRRDRLQKKGKELGNEFVIFQFAINWKNCRFPSV